MLISDTKKFVFIHVYKTAGTSVSHLFLPHSRLIYRIAYKYLFTRKLIALHARIFHLENEGQKYITGIHKHATAREVLEKLGRDKFDSYFTFCFVRNPYDHMVSLYHYIKTSRGHYLHKFANDLSFDEFVLYYIEQGPQTQSDFTYIGQKKVVQFIGKFESLERDVQTICTQIGIPFKGLLHKNSSIRNRDLLCYFSNSDTLHAFNKYFEVDFVNFKYDQINSFEHSKSSEE